MQTDLFGAPAGPADPIIGLTVDMQDPCKCGDTIMVIGTGRGPHKASLHCRACGNHRGWMSAVSHRFITETTKQFGRTEEPIKVRRVA
jgi:hypothetical protein